MKLFDIVRPVGSENLCCGTILYRNAVVVELVPFILISQCGTMTWRSKNIRDFLTIDTANRTTIIIVQARMEKDALQPRQMGLKIKPWNECRDLVAPEEHRSHNSQLMELNNKLMEEVTELRAALTEVEMRSEPNMLKDLLVELSCVCKSNVPTTVKMHADLFKRIGAVIK